MLTRTQILKWAFALYAILSLVAMAPMGIGAALLAFAILFTSKATLLPSKGSSSLRNEIATELGRSSSKIYFRLSLFLALACAISLLYATLSPLGYGGHFVNPELRDMAKAWYLFWPILLVLGLRRLSNQEKKFVFQAWILAFTVLSVVGIFQYFTGWPRNQPIPFDTPSFFKGNRYHATLFLGHHLSVASIFIFPFFAALEGTQFKKNRNPILFSGAALFGLVTLFFTYSRTLWVALPLGILIWALWALPKQWKIGFVSCFLLGLLALSQYPPLESRLHQTMGLNTRKDLWLANFEFFQQRPITGVGWRHTIEISGYYLMQKLNTADVFSGHAHNNFLEMLGGTGLLGTTTWMAWCLGVIWILFKQKNRSQNSEDINFSRGLICAWIVFHINGLTQVNFWEGKVEHQMAWVIAWSLL